jgi:signal transduction histidine kinase
MRTDSAHRATLVRSRLSPRQADWVVFAAVTALSIPWLVSSGWRQGQLGWALLLWPFGTLPVLWRRTRPGTAMAVMLGCALLASSWSASAEHGAGTVAFSGGIGPIVGVYSAALYGARRTRRAAAASAAAALVSAFGVVIATGTAKPLGHLAGLAFGYGVAWVVGDRTRTRRAYLGQLEARAVAAEHERDEHVRRAAEMERARIARELHDVIAHQVSVIAIQAGAARATYSTEPARAAETLALVERLARTTLAELRSLLGMLRKDQASHPPLRPSPTLASLGQLVAQARATGLEVDLELDPATGPLPAVLELSAYRLVQEALTNAIKHAPGAKVVVTVARHPGELAVDISDDGPGAVTGEGTAGHGLVGMRERVELAGGRLRIHTAPGLGFRVDARLPVAGSEPAADLGDRQPSLSAS